MWYRISIDMIEVAEKESQDLDQQSRDTSCWANNQLANLSFVLKRASIPSFQSAAL